MKTLLNFIGSFLSVLYRELNLRTLDVYSELCSSQMYLQKFERAWKNSVCFRISNFTKSVSKRYVSIFYKCNTTYSHRYA